MKTVEEYERAMSDNGKYAMIKKLRRGEPITKIHPYYIERARRYDQYKVDMGEMILKEVEIQIKDDLINMADRTTHKEFFLSAFNAAVRSFSAPTFTTDPNEDNEQFFYSFCEELIEGVIHKIVGESVQ